MDPALLPAFTPKTKVSFLLRATPRSLCIVLSSSFINDDRNRPQAVYRTSHLPGG